MKAHAPKAPRSVLLLQNQIDGKDKGSNYLRIRMVETHRAA